MIVDFKSFLQRFSNCLIDLPIGIVKGMWSISMLKLRIFGAMKMAIRWLVQSSSESIFRPYLPRMYIVWLKTNNEKIIGKPGSISVSGQLPTYPSPNPTFTPNLLSIDCCWVRGGVGGQLLRYWYWSANRLENTERSPSWGTWAVSISKNVSRCSW